jgi:hypothetical protein
MAAAGGIDYASDIDTTLSNWSLVAAHLNR